MQGDVCRVRGDEWTVSCLPLQKDLEAELKDNAAEQERLTGSSLVYGETVQVRVGGGRLCRRGWEGGRVQVRVRGGQSAGEGGKGTVCR